MGELQRKKGLNMAYKTTMEKHKKYVKEFYLVTKFIVAVMVIAIFLSMR